MKAPKLEMIGINCRAKPVATPKPFASAILLQRSFENIKKI